MNPGWHYSANLKIHKSWTRLWQVDSLSKDPWEGFLLQTLHAAPPSSTPAVPPKVFSESWESSHQRGRLKSHTHTLGSWIFVSTCFNFFSLALWFEMSLHGFCDQWFGYTSLIMSIQSIPTMIWTFLGHLCYHSGFRDGFLTQSDPKWKNAKIARRPKKLAGTWKSNNSWNSTNSAALGGCRYI